MSSYLTIVLLLLMVVMSFVFVGYMFFEEKKVLVFDHSKVCINVLNVYKLRQALELLVFKQGCIFTSPIFLGRFKQKQQKHRRCFVFSEICKKTGLF